MWHKQNWMAVASVVLAWGVAVLFTGGPAQATVITTPAYNVPADTTVPFSKDFTLPGAYDPSIGYVPADGVLTQVTLSLTTTATAEIKVINTDVQSWGFSDATATIPVILTGPSSLQVTDTLTAGPISGTALPAPADNVFPGLPASGSTSGDDPNLGFYAVDTEVNFNAASGTAGYSGQSPAPSFTVFFGGGAVAGGDFSATYTYIVPEPSTLALLAVGAAGMLGCLWRRRKLAT